MADQRPTGINLFGYQLSKIEDLKKKAEAIPSFAPPPNEDGAMEVAPGGAYYGTYVDLEGSAKNELELVTKYRELALQAEVDSAIDDIVNEAIIFEDNKSPVEIDLENVEDYPDAFKEKIRNEFKNVLKLLDFENTAYDIFRRWYVDGRMYYHMMIDESNPRDGIQEVRYIDPRRIRKVREPIRTPLQSQPGNSQAVVPVAYNEYFLYMKTINTGSAFAQQGIKISKDSIAYVHSGIMDNKNKLVLGHLHKAIKPMNQLRMLEDAVVIYRLARAPERRVFYIDVGNLPKMKAEQYLKDMMTRHKNRLVYDASTGDIRDDRKYMTMTEDFWLARREGGRGTEIDTLQGGQNLGQMDDVDYFRRKLYKSLHVPVSRIESEATFNFGRANEITRDEVKFSRLIDRLRKRFNHLFDTLLETQLILKGIMSRDEWKFIKENVSYTYLRDNYFAELKDQEVMTARLSLLGEVDAFAGKYFSLKYIKDKVLHLTDEEQDLIDQEIEEEGLEPPDPMMQQGQPPFGGPPGAGGPPGGGMPPQMMGPPAAGPPGAGPKGPPQKGPPEKKPAEKKKSQLKKSVISSKKEKTGGKKLTKEENDLVSRMTKLINSVNGME